MLPERANQNGTRIEGDVSRVSKRVFGAGMRGCVSEGLIEPVAVRTHS